MAKIEDKTDLTAIATVDKTLGAIAISSRPMQAEGYYRFGQVTGLVTAAAANSELFQLRWTDSTHLALIQYLRVRCVLTTAFTTAQELIHDVILATGFSAAGSGGTQVVPGAANLMKRSQFPQSKAQELRLATTTGLGAGTKNLNTHAIAAMHGWAGAQGAVVNDLVLDFTNTADYPIVLSQNEGLIVRNGVLMGAVGVVKVSVEVAWAEILATKFPNFAA
jgi:hypothetical protein